MMHTRLYQWFKREKRTLPWRCEPTPYSVWVSEVMLQQTQVAVVIPYYERWMGQFPTIEALAAAPIDAVIKLWEGLGYYSRARNLHAAAKHVVEKHGGQLPNDAEALLKIKGLGPYTVGAIRSFAFHQKAAAVDGNVMRVLTRYFYIQEDLCQSRTVKQLWKLAEDILPDQEPWVFTEALIELGATVCTKKPKCLECPLMMNCQGHRQGAVDELPYKSTKVHIEKLHRAAALISTRDGCWLVRRVQSGEVMSDLHEFPYFATSHGGMDQIAMEHEITTQFKLNVSFERSLPLVQHTFTRFNVSLYAHHFLCRDPKPVPDYQWMSSAELDRIAFSSGHRRLFAML